MLYISARLRMHACSAYKPRPHFFVEWLLSGKRRKVILFELIVLRRLQTFLRVDAAISAWSCALTTAWSCAYCAITIMATNT